MVPRGINLRINASNNLSGGRQCWNSVYQSASISGWKGKLGHVRLPTVTVDRKTDIFFLSETSIQ